MISNKDLYENIKNNKVYLDIPYSNFEQCIDNKHILQDYKQNFKNISLNFITKNNQTNNNQTNNNQTINNQRRNNNILKFKNDSFINELGNLLMKNNREIKNEIKDFVNSNNNLDYLKTLTRSYKKFRIDLHNLLLNNNIDKIITDNLLIIICKLYNINIVIFKDNIYKIYEINKENDYYIFEKHIKNTENNKNVNFKLLNNKNIDEYLKDKKKYKDDKELKNMKIDELRQLANQNNIITSQKKSILIDKLYEIYNTYN